MKNLCGILFFVCTITVKAQYKIFPDSTAIWGYIKYGNPNICNNGICEIDMVYQITSDTVLFTNNYHQLHSATAYLGGLREDSLLKKVFFIQAGDSSENLLYDFSLNVGDTIQSLSNCSMAITVTSIDSTNNYSPDYRRIFHVSSPGNDFIEGIGSLGGILAPLCNGIDFHWDLTCLSIDGNLIFSTGNPLLNCLNPLAMSEFNKRNAVTLTPNVLRSGQTISINFNYIFPIEKIEIINIEGKVLEVNINDLTVSTTHLQSGIFFLSITARDQTKFRSSFIIQ